MHLHDWASRALPKQRDLQGRCTSGSALPRAGTHARQYAQLGIPDGVTFAAMSQEIGNAFIKSGDLYVAPAASHLTVTARADAFASHSLQPAPAKLLGPAIEDGMRLLGPSLKRFSAPPLGADLMLRRGSVQRDVRRRVPVAREPRLGTSRPLLGRASHRVLTPIHRCGSLTRSTKKSSATRRRSTTPALALFCRPAPAQARSRCSRSAKRGTVRCRLRRAFMLHLNDRLVFHSGHPEPAGAASAHVEEVDGKRAVLLRFLFQPPRVHVTQAK
jgi:hypothetical protein